MRLLVYSPWVVGLLFSLVARLPAQNIHVWTAFEMDAPATHSRVRICPDEIYIWNNHILTASGTYCDTLLTADGIDSIACLQLEVQPEEPVSVRATVCAGESLIWNRWNLHESGTYRDTFSSSSGCDSIVELRLSVLDPLPVTMFGAAICAGTEYVWGGERYRTPGVYTRQLQSLNGCDSIVQLTLMVLDEVPTAVLDTFIFENDTLYTGHSALTASGFRIDTFPSWYGCDSLVQIRVAKLQGARRMADTQDLDVALAHLPEEKLLRLTLVSEHAIPVRAVLYNQKGRPMVQIHAAVRINEPMPEMKLPLDDVPPGPCFLLVETRHAQRVLRFDLEP